MLSLTPCDLFPLIMGRTVWLVGDSIMQVTPCLTPLLHYVCGLNADHHPDAKATLPTLRLRAQLQLQGTAASMLQSRLSARGHVQEFTKAVQCFFVEFLPDNLENVPLEHLTPDRQVLERLEGGWCAKLPNDTRLCHVRW